MVGGILLLFLLVRENLLVPARILVEVFSGNVTLSFSIALMMVAKEDFVG